MFLSIQFANAHSKVLQRTEAAVITASEIHAMQNSDDWNERFVIVDVRAKTETDVSIIPGAITKSEFERTLDQHRDKAVIVYCTIGHRSERYARKIRAKGWRTYNYKGSILDWCERQFSLMTTDGMATNCVHTYSSKYTAAEGYKAVH